MNEGDRVWIDPKGIYWTTGPFGGMWATVTRDIRDQGSPIVPVRPDGSRMLIEYTVKRSTLTKGSTCSDPVIRPVYLPAVREV